MHSYMIRTATEEDVPALIQLRLAYLREDFGELPEEMLRNIECQLPEYFHRHLNKDCFAFLAEGEHGDTVGCALLCAQEKPANPFFPSGRVGEVLGVYVLPEYRRNRIATWLMKLLMVESMKMELDVVRLGATQEGYSVYSRLGFEQKEYRYIDMEYSFVRRRKDPQETE